MTALLGTTTIFACFSAAALVTKRRSYLYLGGLLSSALSLLMVMRLGGALFGRGMLLFQAELYLGLLVFVGYVLVDTQVGAGGMWGSGERACRQAVCLTMHSAAEDTVSPGAGLQLPWLASY